jgi:tetratricopeptide (TPR) repeat protein
MGDVYRAEDTVLDRTVAVKILAERYTADSEIQQRFRREARAGARLSGDAHTVTVFDVGEWYGRAFIVMEYLGGGTLAEALRQGIPPPDQALGWLGQAAFSLDAAHAKGVVHRDIKPGNLLLDERGSVYVADFGIATATGLDSLTATGTVLGTAGYLSPEQAQGQPATAASDRYALAVVAFELLTGSRPFEAETPTAEAAAHAFAEVPSASERRPALPAAVDSVFRAALDKRPLHRYLTCSTFVSALSAACAGADPASAPTAVNVPSYADGRVHPHPVARRWSLVAAGVVVALLAGGGLAAALLYELAPGGAGGADAQRTGAVIATRQSQTPHARTTTARRSPAAVDPHTLNNRGYSLMLAGDYTTALPLLERAVRGLTDPADPVTAYANFNLGQTLVRLGRCSAAVPYLQRAVQLEPDRHEAKDAIESAQDCAGADSQRQPKQPHEHPKPPKHDHHEHD